MKLFSSIFFILILYSVSINSYTIIPYYNNLFLPGISDTTIYIAVDQMPEPLGGLTEIMKKIIYPEEAKKNGIEGKVFVNAVVDENGKIISATVKNGIGYGCDEAAINAIKNSQFKPGKFEGKKVKVRIIIPVQFVLDKKDKTQNKKNINEFKLDSDGKTYISAEKMPSPVGGIESILKTIIYPVEAKNAGIEGMVLIEAIVDKSGKVTKTKILKRIGGGCDEVAVKAITKTKFIPGEIDSKKVDVKIVIPIKFKLE